MHQLIFAEPQPAPAWTIYQVEHPRLGQILAEFHRPISGDSDPHLTANGVHITIEQFRGGQVQFLGYAQTEDGAQMHCTRNMPDYTAARAYAEEWRRQAEQFVDRGPAIRGDVWWSDEAGARQEGRISHMEDLHTAVVVRYPDCTAQVVPAASLRPNSAQ